MADESNSQLILIFLPTMSKEMAAKKPIIDLFWFIKISIKSVWISASGEGSISKQPFKSSFDQKIR